MADLGNNFFALRFQENRLQQPPIVLLFEWDEIPALWIYDTWTTVNPNLVLLNGHRTVPAVLGSDLRISGHRGLVCLQHNQTTLLFEPSTRGSLYLPQLNNLGTIRRACFLGFAQSQRLGRRDFNVLSVSIDTNGVVRPNLLTIQNNPVWRALDYGLQIPHSPNEYTSSVCIDNMIYYGGFTANAASVMKFDILRESFTLIHLPDQLLAHFAVATAMGLGDLIWNNAILFAYRGKLAVAIAVGSGFQKSLWTFDPITSTWSELVVCLHSLTQGLDRIRYLVQLQGTAHCQRKLVFTLRNIIDLSIDYIVYQYDVEGAAPIERFEVDIIPTQNTRYVWNHTDSIWLESYRLE